MIAVKSPVIRKSLKGLKKFSIVKKKPYDTLVINSLKRVSSCNKSLQCTWQTINNYWTRLSKISGFVCGEQINNYLPQPSASANNWSARHWQITIFCDKRVQQLFYHLITEFVLLMNILGKQSDLPLSCKSDHKKEKSMVSFTHEQNIICSQTLLDGIAHDQTTICRQLIVGHVVDFRPMKRKKNLLWIITIIWCTFYFILVQWNSDVSFYKSIFFQFTLAWKLASDSDSWEKLSSSSFLMKSYHTFKIILASSNLTTSQYWELLQEQVIFSHQHFALWKIWFKQCP